MADLAVYTTVYPEAQAYLADWYNSLLAQTDRDFDLWIGMDGLGIDEVVEAIGERPAATWVPASPGDTHAQVRQGALSRIVASCDAVVLVDSDDIMHPSRVAAARDALRTTEVAGCALRLVNEEGADLGGTLTLPQGMRPEDVLPRYNVFGLSNTAYGCASLRQCLPLPPAAVLVDWYLVTRAWLRGISLSFDRRVRMDYRQYGTNTAQVLPPFTPERIIADTARVRQHLAVVMASADSHDLVERLELVEDTARDVALFKHHVVGQPDVLRRYAAELGALGASPLWWSSVAHPALRDLWTNGEEPK